MIRMSTITEKGVVFLESAVKSGLNIIVAGGEISGLTDDLVHRHLTV